MTAVADSPLQTNDLREQVHAAYHRMGYDEFVCPSNIRNTADYVLTWPFSHFKVTTCTGSLWLLHLPHASSQCLSR